MAPRRPAVDATPKGRPMTHYLKWTRAGRVPSYQGGPALPPIGEWTDTVPHPKLCVRGWHACRWEDARLHLAAELWVCELAGVVVQGPDKVVAERCRLVRQVDTPTWSLFAADCAERALPLFEARYPDDRRPRRAIEAARAAAADAAAANAAAERFWQTGRLLIHYCGLDPAEFEHR